MSKKPDLNKLSARFFHGNYFATELPNGAFYTQREMRNYSARSEKPNYVSVHFEQIEDLFVDLAGRYDVVVGAVAWLTNLTILSALSKPAHVAIVVQKEDFLRRDIGVISYPDWKKELHASYKAIHPFNVSDFSETYPGQQEYHPDYNSAVQSWLFNASGEFKAGGESIRCLGYARANNQEIPRLHHKFLVFGDRHDSLVMVPRCVVSGSFNLTRNAVRSRENVLVVEDKTICHAFLSEWAQLWCLSEGLDWTSPEPLIAERDMST
jgi:hypothetical protein